MTHFLVAYTIASRRTGGVSRRPIGNSEKGLLPKDRCVSEVSKHTDTVKVGRSQAELDLAKRVKKKRFLSHINEERTRKEGVGPLRREDELQIKDHLGMVPNLKAYFASVFTRDNNMEHGGKGKMANRNESLEMETTTSKKAAKLAETRHPRTL